MEDVMTAVVAADEKVISTPFFATVGDMVRWMRWAVKAERWQAKPAKWVAIYADGHVDSGPAGTRGGSIASNYSFMIGTMTGKMEHKHDASFAAEITKRGGVMMVYVLR